MKKKTLNAVNVIVPIAVLAMVTLSFTAQSVDISDVSSTQTQYPIPQRASMPCTPPIDIDFGGSGSDSDYDYTPTQTRPFSSGPPQGNPSTSNRETVTHVIYGWDLSYGKYGYEDVSSIPLNEGDVIQAAPMANAYNKKLAGLQHWVLYNGAWSFGPAGILSGQSISTVLRIDEDQTIYSYEKHLPSGEEVWKRWGYCVQYYVPGIFTADQKGWHELAIYGVKSGWSNVIWVYVW